MSVAAFEQGSEIVVSRVPLPEGMRDEIVAGAWGALAAELSDDPLDYRNPPVETIAVGGLAVPDVRPELAVTVGQAEKPDGFAWVRELEKGVEVTTRVYPNDTEADWEKWDQMDAALLTGAFALYDAQHNIPHIPPLPYVWVKALPSQQSMLGDVGGEVAQVQRGQEVMPAVASVELEGYEISVVTYRIGREAIGNLAEMYGLDSLRVEL